MHGAAIAVQPSRGHPADHVAISNCDASSVMFSVRVMTSTRLTESSQEGVKGEQSTDIKCLTKRDR